MNNLYVYISTLVITWKFQANQMKWKMKFPYTSKLSLFSRTAMQIFLQHLILYVLKFWSFAKVSAPQ